MFALPLAVEAIAEVRDRSDALGRLGALVVIYSLAAGVGAAAWAVRRRCSELASPPAVAMDRRILLIVVLVGAGLAAIFLGSNVGQDPRSPERVSEWAATTFAVVAAATVTPIVEELVFRGVLYQHLRQRGPGRDRRWPWAPVPLTAAAVSSAVFAASHYRVRSLGQIGLLVGVGFVLAIVYEVTGRLWVPVVIHAAVNLSAGLAALDVDALPRATTALGLLIVVTVVLAHTTGPEPPVIGRDALRPLGTSGWRRHVYVPSER